MLIFCISIQIIYFEEEKSIRSEYFYAENDKINVISLPASQPSDAWNKKLVLTSKK
jgi:hypothetical protein